MQLEVETRNLLGQTGKRELHSRAFGAGLSGSELLAKSLTGQTRNFGFGPEPHQLVVHRRVSQLGLVAPGLRNLSDHAALTRCARTDGNTLVVQGGGRNLPSLTFGSEAIGVRNPDVREEYLVEFGLAGDLAQRTDVDAGSVMSQMK